MHITEHRSIASLARQVKPSLIRPETSYNLTVVDNHFGLWLLTNRKKAKLTQAQVADIARISKAYVGHIENTRPHGTSGTAPKPSREIVTRLAKAVRGDVDQALLLSGYAPEVMVKDTRDVLDGVTIQFDRSVNLSDEDKEKIMAAVRLIAAGVKAETQK